MKHVNVLWPKPLEAEYLRLCDEFYDTITDEEAENDSIFFAKQEEYINEHAFSKPSSSLASTKRSIDKVNNW